jgi:hypothetical protein
MEVTAMEFNEVISAIGSAGFPIVASIGIFWYMTKQLAAHKEETDGLKAVIQENTIALVELKQYIEDRKV